MKKLLLIMLAAAASFGATDYSGVYIGKGTEASSRYTNGVPHTMQMTLQQSGNSLQGTVQLDKGPVMPITSGTVSGSSISIAVGNGAFQATGQLTVNGSQVTGTMTSSSGTKIAVVFTKH